MGAPEIFESLNDLEATITDYRRNSSTLDSIASSLALKSLERRRDELKLALEALSERSLIDVCDYELMPSREGRYPIKHVGQTISRFQDAVTAFFAAIKDNKPKTNITNNLEIIAASTLNYGYSYSGSLGIVMYAFNEELLPNGSTLDQAVHEVLSLTSETDLVAVKEKADRFGKAAIRSFYSWTKAQTDAGMALDIKWKRGSEVKEGKVIQPEQLHVIQDIIKMAGDTRETPEVVQGLLVALNLTGRGYFKIVFPDESRDEISGSLDEDFNRRETHELPHNYEAVLIRSLKSTLYTDDDDKPTWRLVALK